MLISIDWIKDFVDLADVPAKELGVRVTLGVAEVEKVQEVGTHLKTIRVAEITGVRKHPEADQLNLVTFSIGEQAKTLEVVCGAPNVRVGLKVPFAPIGTTFPNGMVLQPKKIRGTVSEGMLCSQTELGLGEDSRGLMELGCEAILGQDLLTYLKKKEDTVLDIDNKSLTHRPDLWGHYGFAREMATLFNKELKNPFSSVWKEKLQRHFSSSGSSPIVPRIEGETSCLVYYGLSLSGVEIQESPAWMQQRLLSVGLRPINNIVDISNYCMLELGIPLHIFDRDLIHDGQIIIRQVQKEGASFQTLDGVERGLSPRDTVICDSHGPLVLAGIMGGKNCEVGPKTRNIFIEVANWKAAEVRKTSTRLGLRTDSSQRYEKSLDSALCERTLLRTLELVLSLCPQANVQGKIEVVGTESIAKRPLVLTTSYQTIVKSLGVDIEAQTIRRILTSLDFAVEEKEGKLIVGVPSYRSTKDIEVEADLVEEIGRIIGYDNIPPRSPLGEIQVTRLGPKKELHRKIQDFMVTHAQSLEITSYPLVGKKLLEKTKWGELNENLVLINSLGPDNDRMRPSLIPSLLEVAQLNQKNFDQFRFFELGRSYLSHPQNFVEETSHLGIVYYNKNSSVLIEAINGIEKLMKFLNLPAEIVEGNVPGSLKLKNPVLPHEWPGRHPHEYLQIKIMGKWCGGLTTVHPLVLRDFKMGGFLTIAILDLTSFENKKLKEKTSYVPLSKFPVSHFDCTVVVGQRTPVGDILKSLRGLKLKELTSSKIVGVYSLNDQQKTVTIRSTFSDPEKTLSGEFLTMGQDKIVKSLEYAGFPLKS